jgi:hypothetical protein
VKKQFSTLERAAVAVERTIFALDTTNCAIIPRPGLPDVDAIVRDLELETRRLFRGAEKLRKGQLGEKTRITMG